MEYLNEVFEHFGIIKSRKMFGGHGIYHNGLMFGLVADDVLYLKADKDNAHYFTELGLSKFEFHTHDKIIRMSYYAAPEGIFDDPKQAQQWAELAFAAALRASAIKARKISNKKTLKNEPS